MYVSAFAYKMHVEATTSLRMAMVSNVGVSVCRKNYWTKTKRRRINKPNAIPWCVCPLHAALTKNGSSEAKKWPTHTGEMCALRYIFQLHAFQFAHRQPKPMHTVWQLHRLIYLLVVFVWDEHFLTHCAPPPPISVSNGMHRHTLMVHHCRWWLMGTRVPLRFGV